MSTTATKQLWFHGNATANTADLVYTCPAGFRTILKEVNAWSSTGTTDYRIAVTSVQGVTVRLLQGTLTANVPASWSGWLVMEPGDQIFVFTAALPTNSVGSGSQLLVYT